VSADKNARYKFYEPVRVRFNETDLQGHVNFIWYAAYFDLSLTEYMKTLGYSYKDMIADGIDMFYVGTGTEMHARAFFEDALNVHARLGRIGNSSMTFEFAVRNAESDELIASGYINAVCVSEETKRPQRVPDTLRDAVTAYEGATPPA
jgi:acyl-CoA thioester hydrolase